MDEATGLLSITPAQFANLQSLFFNIGGVSNNAGAVNYLRLTRPSNRLRSSLLRTLKSGLVL